jgi:hypothetical protein
MNRTQRIALISPAVVGLLGGALFASMRADSSTIGCDEEAVIGTAGLNSDVATGRGTAAIVGDRIVMVQGVGRRSVHTPPVVGKGVIRHAASRTDRGTAYVVDENGPDSLVEVGTGGVAELSASGEVTHPSWSTSGGLVWAEDFQELKLTAPGSQSPTSIGRPPGSTAVFSPVFTRPGELLAVVQEPVAGYSGADDNLNNLYRYDVISGSWTKVTAFQATAENWSVLRTPVVAPDGTVFFVRLRGAASETRPASFELWSLRRESASKLRDLPGEMFLAGVTDEGLLWNIDDGTAWRLFLESTAGLVDLGCGAVQVDPRAQADPDVPKEDPPSDRRSSRERAPTSNDSATTVDAEMAILVGDFSSRQEAEAVATGLGVPGLNLVTHGTAPLAIAPGKWGVAQRLEADADPTMAVQEFRRNFPDYADRAWVVSLAGGVSTG